ASAALLSGVPARRAARRTGRRHPSQMSVGAVVKDTGERLRKDGANVVRETIEGAQVVRLPASGAPGADRPKESGGSAAGELPITPIGINGDKIIVLDQRGQLRTPNVREVNRRTMISLCGEHPDTLDRAFPRYNKNGKVIGADMDAAERWLMSECARRGIVELIGRVRGAGAWLGDDGGLALHHGD